MQLLDNECRDRKAKYKVAGNARFEISQDRVYQIKQILDEIYPTFSMCGELSSHKSLDLSKESFFKLKNKPDEMGT